MHRGSRPALPGGSIFNGLQLPLQQHRVEGHHLLQPVARQRGGNRLRHPRSAAAAPCRVSFG
eukprot:scaffold1136_cov101-Isochrysis_galbana.AAC.3